MRGYRCGDLLMETESILRDIRELRDMVQVLYVEMAGIKERQNSFSRFQERTEGQGERVPVLVLGIISAAIATVGVLIQLWIAG